VDCQLLGQQSSLGKDRNLENSSVIDLPLPPHVGSAPVPLLEAPQPAAGWHMDRIMNALAAGHDAAVRMIDTWCACTSTEPASRTIITKIWVAHDEGCRARFTRWWTPRRCSPNIRHSARARVGIRRGLTVSPCRRRRTSRWTRSDGSSLRSAAQAHHRRARQIVSTIAVGRIRSPSPISLTSGHQRTPPRSGDDTDAYSSSMGWNRPFSSSAVPHILCEA
jgi:hypothetical protein